jgi:acyl-lipid omega-6 desaturase (Delta-12 desaturase)
MAGASAIPILMTLTASVAAPAPPRSDFPHRREIRSWLAPLSTPSTRRALALVALDIGLFAAGLCAVVLLQAIVLKLAAGALTGIVIGRLFILGHDACHQSLTRHRGLNRWLGRLVFLPSLTPYSLWEVGHNVVHHGYTNLRGVDFVWQPNTLDEYRAMSRGRRALTRAYRSGWSPWLYYLVEIWWARLLFPNARRMPTRRPEFTRDSLLVSGFAALWIAALAVAARATGQSALLLVGSGFILPFLVWNGLIGFVVYVHHTHAGVSWYQDKPSWAAAMPFVSTTVHLTFRSAAGSLLHHITEHTAHHVDMSVPLYRLEKAQAELERRLRPHIIVQPFSWRWYAETARRCKLYDFESGCWTDFEGRPTSPATAGSSS